VRAELWENTVKALWILCASHRESRQKLLTNLLRCLGYENNCGGFGDVVLNVNARKLTVERNYRFEDYTTTTYEV
jgi:hypothetical protein